MPRVALLLATALATLACVRVAQAEATVWNWQVEPQREDCVYEDIEAGQDVEATVLVYRGGKLDIKMRIESPTGVVMYERLIYSAIDEATGAQLNTIVKKGYRFTANMPGTYAFCMDNRMARWTAKVVTFELDVRRNALDGAPVVNRDVVAPVAPAAGEGSAEGSAEPAHVSMMQAVSRIRARLLVVENGQYYHYNRERRHRDTVESTNSRVQWWTFGEAVIAIAITILQVLTVRSWVSKPGGLPGGV